MPESKIPIGWLFSIETKLPTTFLNSYRFISIKKMLLRLEGAFFLYEGLIKNLNLS
jgi:hypothetical protein